jgi:hypothetical protein
MRSRRCGAALSSSSTSYQVRGIWPAAARSASIALSTAFWASRSARPGSRLMILPTRVEDGVLHYVYGPSTDDQTSDAEAGRQ